MKCKCGAYYSGNVCHECGKENEKNQTAYFSFGEINAQKSIIKNLNAQLTEMCKNSCCYDDLKKAQEKVAAEEIKLLKMTGTKSNQYWR